MSATLVSITGERRTENQDRREDGMTRSEFHYGKIPESGAATAQVQNNAVEADYKDGILKASYA